jgi:site-specific DNA-methyltransferase (adenine-specific)
MTNRLYYGDNLDVLREHVKDESVDLVYLDPPFNSNANYNILFKSPTGSSSDAQIEAFEDTWHGTTRRRTPSIRWRAAAPRRSTC